MTTEMMAALKAAYHKRHGDCHMQRNIARQGWNGEKRIMGAQNQRSQESGVAST